MNIKALLGNNILPSELRGIEKTEKSLKSGETQDRDANGQQAFGDRKGQKEPMTDEQLEKALEHLRNLPATKEHRWVVELETTASGKFVLVKDNLGTMIRRIPELDLWSLPDDQNPKGQLLKTAA